MWWAGWASSCWISFSVPISQCDLPSLQRLLASRAPASLALHGKIWFSGQLVWAFFLFLFFSFLPFSFLFFSFFFSFSFVLSSATTQNRDSLFLLLLLLLFLPSIHQLHQPEQRPAGGPGTGEEKPSPEAKKDFPASLKTLRGEAGQGMDTLSQAGHLP